MSRSDSRIILGIDPGLADTGFGVITQSGQILAAVTYGTIKTAANLQITERLKMIHRSMTDLITQYHPVVIAVERLFFAKNVKTATVVGQARGVILLTAGQHNIPIEEFTPLEIKMALSGYGRADKQQIQQMVRAILRLTELPKPDDAADALAAAICCSQHKKF